jgi:hypothetical protein
MSTHGPTKPRPQQGHLAISGLLAAQSPAAALRTLLGLSRPQPQPHCTVDARSHTQASRQTRLLRAPANQQTVPGLAQGGSARPIAAGVAYRRFKAAGPLRGLHAVCPRHGAHAERLDTSIL